jgi:hypothetical protein
MCLLTADPGRRLIQSRSGAQWLAGYGLAAGRLALVQADCLGLVLREVSGLPKWYRPAGQVSRPKRGDG